MIGLKMRMIKRLVPSIRPHDGSWAKTRRRCVREIAKKGGAVDAHAKEDPEDRARFPPRRMRGTPTASGRHGLVRALDPVMSAVRGTPDPARNGALLQARRRSGRRRMSDRAAACGTSTDETAAARDFTLAGEYRLECQSLALVRRSSMASSVAISRTVIGACHHTAIPVVL
jgi:hypothetical protein